jgi:predicted transcriptional regulator
MTGSSRERVDSAARDQAVLAAMSMRSQIGGVVTISLREICAHTGISRGSVARALDRLISKGSIGRLKSSTHTVHANRYRVCELPLIGLEPSFLWSRYGLGATSSLVYQAMPEESWMRVCELAALVKCSKNTVRTAAARLHSAGLIDGKNMHDDRNPRKTHWRRFDSNEYLSEYTHWLTDKAADNMRKKILQEQRSWAAREKARMREIFRPDWDQRSD